MSNSSDFLTDGHDLERIFGKHVSFQFSADAVALLKGELLELATWLKNGAPGPTAGDSSPKSRDTDDGMSTTSSSDSDEPFARPVLYNPT